MTHEPKNYDRLIGECQGFLSETQLKAHFTLYQGYVKKLGEIETALQTTDRSTANYSYSPYSELRRREPVAYNGTVLHEMYFENLGAKGGSQVPDHVKKAAEKSFGSWDNWVADVKAMAASGHGWVLVNWDHNHQKLRNNLVSSEHHIGLFANNEILLALDCWEHAYFADYQTKKADYFGKLLEHLSWNKLGERTKAFIK